MKRPQAWLLAIGFALVVAACASAKNGDGGPDAHTDARPDASDPCDGVVCEGLSFCNEFGVCMPFSACAMQPTDGDAGVDPVPECPDGTTCRNGFCLPDDDFDGDGYGAVDDCDETNPDIHPNAPEICNGIDDNCAAGPDEADPMVMCATDPTGEVCSNGDCVCLPDHFDLDPTIPDCECVAAPVVALGTNCANAIELGQIPDTGMMRTETGNIPNGRKVYYHFRSVDQADATCDNYHVRSALIGNPADQFRIRMMRGACDDGMGADATTYEWALDFRATIGGNLAGQCPCWSGTPVDNVSPCGDDSADYWVVVERTAGSPTSCDAYSLELSNGVYDWM